MKKNTKNNIALLALIPLAVVVVEPVKAFDHTAAGWILVEDGPIVDGKFVPVPGIPGADVMPTRAYGGKAQNGASISCRAVISGNGTCTLPLPAGYQCDGYGGDGITPLHGSTVTLGGAGNPLHSFNCKH